MRMVKREKGNDHVLGVCFLEWGNDLKRGGAVAEYFVSATKSYDKKRVGRSGQPDAQSVVEPETPAFRDLWR